MLVSQIRFELQKELGKQPDAFVIDIVADKLEITEHKNIGKSYSDPN